MVGRLAQEETIKKLRAGKKELDDQMEKVKHECRRRPIPSIAILCSFCYTVSCMMRRFANQVKKREKQAEKRCEELVRSLFFPTHSSKC